MKKVILISIASMGISFYVFAQSAGDYRSVGYGNWNDATKWQVFNGSGWIATTTYPGENPGTGTVTISHETGIRITETVLNPVAKLSVSANYPTSIINYDCEIPFTLPCGVLTFSAENDITLIVAGDVDIIGQVNISDQNGINNHTLSIGRNLSVAGAVEVLNCYGYVILGDLQTTNMDDKLGITFNSTDANSSINSLKPLSFHDIAFNGTGLSVNCHISITGNANFINGIVKCGIYGSSITFLDGSTVSGGSNLSFVDGIVQKYGDDPFTFPIGNLNVYAPLSISRPARMEPFYAYYERNSGLPGIITDTALRSISSCERWILSNDGNYSFTYPFDVTVGWTSSDRCGSISTITNVNDITLTQYNSIPYSNTWDSHGGVGVGSVNNGTVTYSGVKSVGSFTLGNVGTSCQTPSALTTTNTTSNSARLSWPAVAGALNYDVDYRLQFDLWINASTATTSTSVNLAGLKSSAVYEWKVRANCGSTTSTYRQSQFKTLNECGTPANLYTSNITSSSAQLNWNGVTNANGYQIQYKPATAVTWTTVNTGSNTRSYIINGLASSTSYNWRILAYCLSGNGDYGEGSFSTTGCSEAFEANNTSTQAKEINLGSAITAGITSVADVDWFKITTPNSSNTNVEVTLTNLPADYDLYVYNKSLKLVGSSTANGISNEVVFFNSSARKAVYYIKVVGKNAAFNTTQCYSLQAQSLVNSITALQASDPAGETTGGPANTFLYPNPAAGYLFLEFDSNKEGLTNMEIFNTAGQLIKKYAIKIAKGYNQFKITVSDIRQGMYLLRVNNSEINITRRFVIAR